MSTRASSNKKKKKTTQRDTAREPPSEDATAESSQGSHKLVQYTFQGMARCMICDGPVPSALTAIYNYFLCHLDRPKEVYSHQSEEQIREFVKGHLSFKMKELKESSSISEDELKLETGLKEVIQSLGPDNLVSPILKSIADFKKEGVTQIFKYLGVPLIHGWMMGPEEELYESLKSYSHEDLELYVKSLNDDLSSDAAQKRNFIKTLLDVRDKHTIHGYAYISYLLNDGVLAVLYWNKKFNLIYYENGNLLLLETDPHFLSMYPKARWRVFEEVEAENIYLDDEFGPAAKQPNVAMARAWYSTMLSKRFADEPIKLSKGQRKRQRNLQKKAAEKKQEDSNVALADQGGNNQAAEGEIPIPSNAQADSPAPEGSNAKADYPPSETDQRETNQAAADENVVPSNVGQPDSPASEKSQGGNIQAATEKTLEPSNIAQPGSPGSEKGQVGDDQAQTSSKDQHKSPVADQFLQFLRMFRDDDDVLYFEGVVSGMKHTGSPKFRVPYDFIKAHNNKLAMTICESYPRIFDDLMHSVCVYLKENGVEIAPELHIRHLPDAKSDQTFLSFVENMEFVEKYDVYAFEPVESESPSFIARDMSLGFLHSIVEKFRKGRCFGGRWDESNMVVRDSAPRYEIVCEDEELTAERGFLDLDRFDKVVLQRFKSKDGKLPPYFEELQQDFKLIRKYMRTEKWDRFLLLISYPLALKAPMVRSSLFEEMYQSAETKCSASGPLLVYLPLHTRNGLTDWRDTATKHWLFKEVYDHKNFNNGPWTTFYAITKWAVSYWSLLKYLRNFINHALRCTKRINLGQKVQDLAIVDLMLARQLGEYIAKLYRFFILNCDIDGLFSSPWRHFIKSDCADKPRQNNSNGTEKVEDALVAAKPMSSISPVVKHRTGYAMTGIQRNVGPGTSSFKSVLIANLNMNDLKEFLTKHGFEVTLQNDGQGDDILLCVSESSECTVYKSYRTRMVDKDTLTFDRATDPEITITGPIGDCYYKIFQLLPVWLGM